MADEVGVSKKRLAEIIADMKTVGGWFTHGEARYMAETLQYALREPGRYNVVEVGSYEGRSTVVLANIVRLISPTSIVWCIDPFDGEVEKDDKRTMTPTYNTFMGNIRSRGLDRWVRPIVKRSTDVEWDNGPIQFLFIDALHDYDSVVEDFNHFWPHVAKDGFICFHDRQWHDGVVKATNEFVKGGCIYPVGQSNTFFVSSMKPVKSIQGHHRER